VSALEDAGHTVVSEPSLSGEALADALGRVQHQVLVVRSTKVPAEAMDASAQLELIVRAGAGYDTIDVEGASARGIFVSNCPGKNSTAVAELTWGLILSLDRAIPDNVADARAGRWNKGRYAKAAGLQGKVLGVIGTGSIGREVIRRAHAFGLRVVAWSRSLDDETAAHLGVARLEDPAGVAADADIVTLHVASTDDTRHLADRAFFEAMKPGAFFINTTRSAVVDEDALRWAMEEKGIMAAVDVISGEPSAKAGPFEHPLAQHPNLYVTHHIGASTRQAQDAIADEAVRVIRAYDDTGVAPNCVNLADQTPATHQVTVRHLDKVGVLAAVLEEMRKAGWNVQEMDNLVFAGAKAACARIRFDGAPDDAVVGRIAAHEDVLAVSILELKRMHP
jgi:D-3-phosphoglycerate dehydrogenase